MHRTELPTVSQQLEREGSRVAPRPRATWQQRFGGLVLGVGIFLFGVGVGFWVGDEPPWADPALSHALSTLGTGVGDVWALAAGRAAELTGLDRASGSGEEPVEEPELTEPEADTSSLEVMVDPRSEPPRQLVTVRAPGSFTAATLRASPSVSAPSLGLMANGTPLVQLEGAATADSFDWVQVQTPTGTLGWIVATAIN